MSRSVQSQDRLVVEGKGQGGEGGQSRRGLLPGRPEKAVQPPAPGRPGCVFPCSASWLVSPGVDGAWVNRFLPTSPTTSPLITVTRSPFSLAASIRGDAS